MNAKYLSWYFCFHSKRSWKYFAYLIDSTYQSWARKAMHSLAIVACRDNAYSSFLLRWEKNQKNQGKTIRTFARLTLLCQTAPATPWHRVLPSPTHLSFQQMKQKWEFARSLKRPRFSRARSRSLASLLDSEAKIQYLPAICTYPALCTKSCKPW